MPSLGEVALVVDCVWFVVEEVVVDVEYDFGVGVVDVRVEWLFEGC